LIKTSFYDLGLKNGVLIANPVPKDQEADPIKVRALIEEALKEAK
jgi:pseudouridine-5'-phosphate glycosidase